MKIFSNDDILKTAYPHQTNKAEKPAGKQFETILKESIDNSIKAGTGTEMPPMINTISNIRLNALLSGENNPIIDRTEQFLDILDKYQFMLQNPLTTLKDIFPLIQEMGAEKDNLIPMLDSLPHGDGLKDILNQALITSSVEIMKFNRGDYVDL